MIRMLIIGYCYGIRSERRLCEDVHLNLAFRWFCRLDLGGKVPDQSTFSKNRHGRFRESDLFRRVFEGVVQRCIDEGLVGGQGFAVDASLIQADANKQRSVPGNEWDPADVPPDAKQAVQDYLARLDDAAFDAASEVTPKFVSPSDTAAQWTGALRGPAFFAYATNYLVDTDNAIIVDVEATRAIRQAEVGAARTMIERVMDRFGLYPERLAGDSAYGAAEMVGWLVKDQGIEPHVTIKDKSERSDGALFGGLNHGRLGHEPPGDPRHQATAGADQRRRGRAWMADKDLDVLVRGLDSVLKFICEHHLRQLALAINGIGAVVLVPVHVVELDGPDPQFVAKAGHDHDPTFRLLDAVEEHPAKDEVTVMVGAELAFEPVYGEFLCRYLRDSRIADQRVDLGNGLEHHFHRCAHARKLCEVHADKAHIGTCAEFLF